MRFSGVDSTHEPGALNVSQCCQADNLLPWRSAFYSRPGIWGVLLAANKVSGPPYIIGAMRRASGGTAVIFTVQSGAQQGKLYEITKAANGTIDTAATEIKTVSGASASVSASTINKGQRFNKRFYLCDGTNTYSVVESSGTLFFREETGVNTPAAPTGVTLTSTEIADMSGPWTQDTLAWNLSDLAISGANLKHFTSATLAAWFEQFAAVIIGDVTTITFVITGGTNWTPGTYTITGYSTGVFTVNNNLATSTTATGGVGYMQVINDPQSVGAAAISPYSFVTSYNRLPDPQFTATQTDFLGNTVPVGYIGFGNSPDVAGSAKPTTPSGYNNWMQFDDPGGGIIQGNPSTGIPTSIPNFTIYQDQNRYSRAFWASILIAQRDPTATAASGAHIVFRLTGYLDLAGTQPAGTLSQPVYIPYNQTGGSSSNTYAAAQVYAIFDTSNFGAEIKSFTISCEGQGGVNGTVGQNYCLGTNFQGGPYCPDLVTAVSNGQTNLTQTPDSGNQFAGVVLTQSGMGVGGMRIRWDLSGGAGGNVGNYGAYDSVVLDLSNWANATGLTLALAFVQDGTLATQTRYLTNTFTVDSSDEFATLNISTIPSTIQDSFRWLELVIGGPFVTTTGSLLFGFGPLYAAGNLTLSNATAYAQNYSWVYCEVDNAISGTPDTTLVNALFTNPSPVSATLIPSDTQAMGQITLNAPVNASTTHYAVYRFGGVFQDVPAVARLVGIVPIGSSVAFGADTITDNPYISWNFTTRVFIDDTADQFIQPPATSPTVGAICAYGADGPPTGGTCLCKNNGRLFIAAGAVVYMSWAPNPNAPDVLYWTVTSLAPPDDPFYPVKGAFGVCGSAFDDDNVQAMTPTLWGVVVRKQDSTYLLSAQDASTFSPQTYMDGSGLGLIAPRAASFLVNQEFALVSDGVAAFNLFNVSYVTQPIETYVHPVGWDGNPQIPAAVMQNSYMEPWDQRLMLTAPGSSTSTQNDTLYVFDTRVNGWTRWTVGYTSMASLSGETDLNDLFLGGYDGQIYILSHANYDLASSDVGATQIPITCTYLSRGYGQEEDSDYWNQDQPLYIGAITQSPNTVSVSYSAQNSAGIVQPFPPVLHAAGYYESRVPSMSGTEGIYIQIGMSWSSTSSVRLIATHIEASEGARSTR